jgi:O-antigen ligase
LASVVPLVIARLRQRGRWNAVLWIIAVLLILGVVATSSRGGTLALGAVLFVLSLRHWEARLLLLAGVILVLVIAPLLPTVGYLYDRFRLTDSSTYTSTVLRLNAFQTGLRMGLDKPLLGTGPFLWADLVDQYAVDAFQGVAASSHSIWVQAFSELGVTGLLLTMALFGAGVWRLWCVWRVPSQSRRAESRKWAILAFALGYIVAVTFLNLLYSRTLFMILGYVVAFAQLRGKGFLLGEEALDSGV